MPVESNGSEDSRERLRRLELLVTALYRDSERLRSELKVVLAAQTRFSEDAQHIWLDVEELRGKLDGQIGFTDLFREEVGLRLKELEMKLSERSNG